MGRLRRRPPYDWMRRGGPSSCRGQGRPGSRIGVTDGSRNGCTLPLARHPAGCSVAVPRGRMSRIAPTPPPPRNRARAHAATLFGEVESPEYAERDQPGPAPVGPFAGVALEQSIDHALDYAIPAHL